jgi:cytochrome d ubiquinol oxidase subunit II
MEALWFSVVSVMLAIYAVLDGYDLGVGAIHLFVARGERDQRTLRAATGRFWDGNEIWLLLAGGALYCGFPGVFASRGFYLSAIALVWVLILRGIGVELRNRFESPRWRESLDVAIEFLSVALALSLGTAVGYVIIGVESGTAVLCGVCGLAILVLQGAAWLALKSDGELQARCRRLASGVWWVVLLGYAGVTIAGFAAQPHIVENLMTNSWVSIFAVLTLAGLIGARLCLNIGFDLGVFASASCVIAGLLISAAAGQFPYLLSHQVTVYSAGSAPAGVSISAIWWVSAFLLAGGYSVSMHRLMRNKAAAR